MPVGSTPGVEWKLPEVMPGDVVHAVTVQVDAVGAAVAPDLHRQVGVVGPVNEVDLEKETLFKMDDEQLDSGKRHGH